MNFVHIRILFLVFVFFLFGELKCQEYPVHTITNGIVTAQIYLPNQNNGFYRATRFDWSGVIGSLVYKDVDYFGQWYSKHNSRVNDAISGPVEEFDEIGYECAEIEDEFLKIGVGGLRKSNNEIYDRFKLYEITNPGEWIIKRTERKVVFKHLIEDVSGYSYCYMKCVELAVGTPKLLITHTLKNTGRKVIKAKVYNHNFLTIGHLLTDSNVVVTFPEDIVGNILDNKNKILNVEKNKVGFTRTISPNESVMVMNINDSPIENSIIVENKKMKAGVKITSDTKYSTIHFWASDRTCCPEPYINIELFPWQEIDWCFKYVFYVK